MDNKTLKIINEFNSYIRTSKVWIHFQDGMLFSGHCNLKENDPRLKSGIWGEAAFTTAMSGYQETITDPSFSGQHIIFSTSHVGNYPSNNTAMQSKQSYATSIIARSFSPNEFLWNIKTPLISDVDTRSLVRYLANNKGNNISVITVNKNSIKKEEFNDKKLFCNDLSIVSSKEVCHEIEGENPIVLINYGCKIAILNNLKQMNYPLIVVPYNTDVDAIKALNPKMIFLSNGPGDPSSMKFQVEVVKQLLKSNIPIRGICLGHQILSLALGARIIKLSFGQRGINHPVIDHTSNKVIITSQNHGYATDRKSFEDLKLKNIFVQYSSLMDQTIEGLSSFDNKIKTVQFHPEGNPGPNDANVFFCEIKEYLKNKNNLSTNIKINKTPEVKYGGDIEKNKVKESIYKKVLIIGSGPIKIGQASEFDYSGTQACKALNALGVQVVLINSNPATIMTDPNMAYKTYIEPITIDNIKKIIVLEKIDAILSTMGGQTALNVCMELEKQGYFEEKNISLLGARAQTIEMTEDRDLFSEELLKLSYKTPKRYKATSSQDACLLSQSVVGFPLIIRRDFSLGGTGAHLIYNREQLESILKNEINFPITLEKSLIGWKEIELEVMVDKNKNGVIICSIENIDPCGVHTGDSITVAPAQTISDNCYQQLRTMALSIAKHMGVVAGGANIQFAINPTDENDIIVIEMNPRVSRSSALASKATGYPIAKISALLAMGISLEEIFNDITKASSVAFEPTLDYIAIKIPIFPFSKFPTSSQRLGPKMRSVGEVLSLGSNFNEAFLKALRSLEMGFEIPQISQLPGTPIEINKEYIKERLKGSKQLSLLTVLEGLRLGLMTEEINNLTAIDPWFIEKMQELKRAEDNISNIDIFDPKIFIDYKILGFSDKYLSMLTKKTPYEILEFRFKYKLFPNYRAVDTCSGEFNAITPYFYSTYFGQNEATPLKENGKSIVIFGSGPNRIGQGIEFDYSCVKSCQYLKNKGFYSIMINSNPETISTDYDTSNRLYLSPLYSEDIFDILCHEDPYGIIACFSGQTGIKIRSYIEKDYRTNFKTFNFLGVSNNVINKTEDRKLFTEITKDCGISQTKSMEVYGYKKLLNSMLEIGMPVIIRPSYVIGGESMYIFYSHEDINQLPESLKNSIKNSTMNLQVENYLDSAIEYDVDLIRDKYGNTVFTVCEHIEHAGVHSGDSGMITPTIMLTDASYKKLKEISIKLAQKLDIVGPINIQYAIKDEKIYCIEANPRGSRTLPFLSKAYGISLPDIATESLLGGQIANMHDEVSNYFCVKQSSFPFDRFLKDDIILGPKMRSTGETMGIDNDKDKALMKSYLGNYPKLNQIGAILISLADNTKGLITPYLKSLKQLGYSFFATPGTYSYIKKQGIECKKVYKINQREQSDAQDILDVIEKESIKIVFNTPDNFVSSKSDGERIRNAAITHSIPCFTRKENIKAVIESILGSYSIINGELIPTSLQDTVVK